ncbi:MAG: hypothetical protein HY509_01390 [Acidobacteria bacterium]|nr:hypothetical protein [Acidobacteriota bacterium]
MRKATIQILAGAAILALALPALAQEKTPSTITPTQMMDDYKTLVGEVTKVDKEKKTVSVKESVKSGEAKDFTFILAENPTLTIQGKVGNLDQLKTGDSVTVKYTTKEGKNIAKEITVAKPKA